MFEKKYLSSINLCSIIQPMLSLLLHSEPCSPNNVQTNVNCQSNQGTVSWEESFGAVGYQARFTGRDGHSLSCYTNTTSCSVEGLHCGVIYHTTVIAIGETRNSSSSNTILLYSGTVRASFY